MVSNCKKTSLISFLCIRPWSLRYTLSFPPYPSYIIDIEEVDNSCSSVLCCSAYHLFFCRLCGGNSSLCVLSSCICELHERGRVQFLVILLRYFCIGYLILTDIRMKSKAYSTACLTEMNFKQMIQMNCLNVAPLLLQLFSFNCEMVIECFQRLQNVHLWTRQSKAIVGFHLATC